MTTMLAAAIQLPDTLGARGLTAALVRRAVPAGTRDVAIGATDTVTITAGAADELVRQLLDLDVERVVLVNPAPDVERLVRKSLTNRARPERTFLLSVQHRHDNAIYRP